MADTLYGPTRSGTRCSQSIFGMPKIIPSKKCTKWQTDAELRDAPRSIPEDIRELALAGDVLGVYVVLCNRWVDGAWRPQPEGPVDGHGGIDRAERFIELVVQTSGPAEG